MSRKGLARKPGKQSVEAIAQPACGNESVWFRIPGEHCNLERRCDFEDFTSRDTEDTRLVRQAPPASGLCNVQANTLGRPQSLIAKLWIFDSCVTHDAKQLESDVASDEAMMREATRWEFIHAPFAQES